MDRSDRHPGAPPRAPSARDRPVARAHRAAAGRSRPSRAAAAAGDPCRRHQRQGLDHRVHARDARSRRASASTSTPRRTSSASTSASASARTAAAASSTRTNSPTRCVHAEKVNDGRADHRSSRSPPPRPSISSRAIPPTSLLLEVGLGGRLDATNVITAPLAAVITLVSLDHEKFLGDTLDGDRRREGRHPQARPPGGRRAAGATRRSR